MKDSSPEARIMKKKKRVERGGGGGVRLQAESKLRESGRRDGNMQNFKIGRPPGSRTLDT